MRTCFTPLLAVALVASVALVAHASAQPTLRPLSQVTVGMRVRGLAPTPDGSLVSYGNLVRRLVDGQWRPVTGSLAGRSFNDATITRTAAGAMYLLAGTSSRHRSTDGGHSWDSIPFAVRAVSERALYGGPIPDSLMASSDAGATWRGVTRPFVQRSAVIAAHPEVREIIAYDPALPGLAISSDDGVTWSDLTQLGTRAWRVRVYPTAMYALVIVGQSRLAIHRSTDRGGTWSVIDSTGDPFTDIVEDPSGRIVRIENERALASTDAGTTWTTVTIGYCDEHPARVTALALDTRGRIAIGSHESGVHRLEEGQWRIAGDMTTQAGGIIVWRHPGELYALMTTQTWRSADAGSTWSCVHGTPTAFDSSGAWYRSVWQIERSTDQGATWAIVGENLNPPGSIVYRSYDPVVLPDGTLVAVYESSSEGGRTGVIRLGSGDAWTTTPLLNTMWNADLTLAPDGTIIFLANGRLHRSTDAGVTWQPIDPTWGPAQISIGLDGTVYGLGYSSALNRYQTRRSTDGGATWTDLATQLERPYGIHAHGSTGVVVLYEDGNVGVSSDGGATFTEVLPMLPLQPLGFGLSDASVTIVRTADRNYFLETPSGVELEEILGPMNLTIHDR